ncbi:MAG TPA: hypothetical protein VGV13_16020 [Methylomirabilota bacterium]|jgi:hypothetical protein|nr:hypothetical protein [Methylomirabilota bacterium]
MLGAFLALVSIALAAAAASAEMTPVGLVTRLDGRATLTRAVLPEGAPLKFRDEVYIADRITTGEHSLARILFGGKALVTVRERSVLTITEAPGVSTLHVGVGKIIVAVVKERVKPGETIDIRTPNAIATIRGTVVIAEVSPETPEADESAANYTTTITILKGVIDLRRLDGLTRQPIGAALSLRAVERVRITGAAALPLPQKLSPEVTRKVINGLKANVKPVPETSAAAVMAEVRHASNTPGAAVSGSRVPSVSASANGPGPADGSKSKSLGLLQVKLPGATAVVNPISKGSLR